VKTVRTASSGAKAASGGGVRCLAETQAVGENQKQRNGRQQQVNGELRQNERYMVEYIAAEGGANGAWLNAEERCAKKRRQAALVCAAAKTATFTQKRQQRGGGVQVTAQSRW